MTCCWRRWSKQPKAREKKFYKFEPTLLNISVRWLQRRSMTLKTRFLCVRRKIMFSSKISPHHWSNALFLTYSICLVILLQYIFVLLEFVQTVRYRRCLLSTVHWISGVYAFVQKLGYMYIPPLSKNFISPHNMPMIKFTLFCDIFTLQLN